MSIDNSQLVPFPEVPRAYFDETDDKKVALAYQISPNKKWLKKGTAEKSLFVSSWIQEEGRHSRNRNDWRHLPSIDVDHPIQVQPKDGGDHAIVLIKSPETSIASINALFDVLQRAGLLLSNTWQPIPDDDGWRHPLPEFTMNCEVRAIPSSTQGHFHLYINAPLSWDAYLSLLKALYYAKVIEDKFVELTVKNSFSLLLRPGYTKTDFKNRFKKSAKKKR